MRACSCNSLHGLWHVCRAAGAGLPLVTQMKSRIFFYLRNVNVAGLPKTKHEYWDWLTTGHSLDESWGRYHWTLLTFLNLKGGKFSPVITDEPPDEGVILCHRDDMIASEKRRELQYWVCLQVDRNSPALEANHHVFHNSRQRLRYTNHYSFIPPWLQSNLIPRDRHRGSKVENIAYFGYEANLHESLRTSNFRAQLHDLDLNMIFVPPAKWHDYRETDVLLGIRTFGEGSDHHRKPALKLMNAWAAGVPAVLGCESAYRAIGVNATDYIEAISSEDLLEALCRLKRRPDLVKALTENGRRKVNSYSDVANINRWELLLETRILPDYEAMVRSSFRRKLFTFKLELLRRIAWRAPALFGTAD